MPVFLRSHVYGPYPELVERERAEAPFEIRDSRRETLPTSGMVDLGRRVIWVPLESGARAVSRHELGHVAWTPALQAEPGFDRRVLMAVEDARVNLGLANVGLPVVPDREARAHILMLLAQDAKLGDALALFMRAVASLGTGVEEPIAEQLRDGSGPFDALVLTWMERARRALEEARAAAGGPVAPYDVGVELASELAHALQALGLLDPRRVERSRAPAGCCIRHEGSGEPPPEDPEAAGSARPARPARDPGEMAAGRLELASAPLVVPLRRVRGGRHGWRAATEGSVVRFLTRWPVDRAVFRRRARQGGGTLLVDTSGSMSLQVADLDRLLRATPYGVRVAIYSGIGSTGQLRIVADRGRRAASEHLASFGNGNIVDLPALAWLTRQPRPRLWLSDGGVTGVGDRGSEPLARRCEALCRRAGIRRVEKLDEAAALLRSRWHGTQRTEPQAPPATPAPA